METKNHGTSYTPKWLKRLIARDGKGAFGSSKHARGRTKPRNWKAAKKKTRLCAKMSRRANRGRR